MLGIGFGDIFSGKTIELKTKENFLNNNKITNEEKTISDSFMINDMMMGSMSMTSSSGAANASIIIKPSNSMRIKAKVLYEYIPTQPDELKLNVGDYIYIIEKDLEDEGWWRGETLTGSVGVFPDNFVEEINQMSPMVLMNGKKSMTNYNDIQEPTMPTMPTMLTADHKLANNNSNSLTSSTMSNSSSSNTSSNNSLSKLMTMAANGKQQTPIIDHHQSQPAPPAAPSSSHMALNDEEANSKSQSELSEELEDINQSETNKLVHIKKTKQMNKRPPSFRKKKVNVLLFWLIK